MYFDKQARALVVPESEINRVCRDGAEIDYRNGWVLNLPGPITIKAKEPNEPHFKPSPGLGTED